MTLQIWGDSISGNCLKVKWTADFLRLGYEWVETSGLARDTRTKAFLAMNPSGQVPLALLEDGRPLAESNAIILYLAEGSVLIPEDAYDRARMVEWLFWEQYSHEPYIAVARFQVKFLGKAVAELDPRIIERGVAALDRLEGALGDGGFLIGASVSLADVALVAYTRWAPEGGFDLAAYPAIGGWIERTERTLDITD